MTVAQLIAALSKFDGAAEIEFPIQTYTRRHPSVYAPSAKISNNDMSYYTVNQVHTNVRIWIHLPEGYSIHEKKKP